MNPAKGVRPQAILALASVASVALNMWIGRGITFSTDELVWFMLSPDLDLSGAFHPYVGHLILTSKALYKLIFETIGPDYRVIRLAAAMVLVGVVWILYRLLRRYCGEWPALAISLVVLFFSGDPAHVFHGNGITVLGSVGLGLFALLMLSEPATRRSVLACLALCLGVATYSQTLPFLVGTTVFLIASKRIRDLWVPAIPFLGYFAWWIWARDLPGSSESSLEPERIFMLPVWGFRATGAVAESLIHLPDGVASGIQTTIGLLIAAGLAALLVWLLGKGRANPLFFAGAATLLTMWALVIVVPVEDRNFDSSRYMYPFLLASVITFGSLIRPGKPGRTLVWVAGIAVAALCLNGVVEQARHNDQQRAGVTVLLRSGLAGVEAVGPTDPSLTADDLATQEEDFFLNLPFRAVDDLEIPSLAAYTAAVDQYGRLGFTGSEIGENGPGSALIADRSAYRVSGIGSPRPLPEGARDLPCRRPAYLLPGPRGVAVPPGLFELRNPSGHPAALRVFRFSHAGTPAGRVPARSAALVGGPQNHGNAGLRMRSDLTLTVCHLAQ
ncbi:MAG TPA: hypothetical protein PKA56_11010 [Solirubrobacterales bacterium]|nr:hypothetical protein [Solirubrobacterales bacterium]HMU26669.1 hypothetical protein [Solirubrobacterales bacterium]HMX72268.1 hypothetical protein [Solirubrobacterales bacterium]HNA24278.1 hypothetical protein [Solirubrobacterales bacterium]HNA44021.1 hypothetical protein [Solirubrobacterales bacterium]